MGIRGVAEGMGVSLWSDECDLKLTVMMLHSSGNTLKMAPGPCGWLTTQWQMSSTVVYKRKIQNVPLGNMGMHVGAEWTSSGCGRHFCRNEDKGTPGSWGRKWLACLNTSASRLQPHTSYKKKTKQNKMDYRLKCKAPNYKTFIN